MRTTEASAWLALTVSAQPVSGAKLDGEENVRPEDQVVGDVHQHEVALARPRVRPKHIGCIALAEPLDQRTEDHDDHHQHRGNDHLEHPPTHDDSSSGCFILTDEPAPGVGDRGFILSAVDHPHGPAPVSSGQGPGRLSLTDAHNFGFSAGDGGTYTQFDVTLHRVGIDATFVDLADGDADGRAIADRTKLLYARLSAAQEPTSSADSIPA